MKNITKEKDPFYEAIFGSQEDESEELTQEPKIQEVNGKSEIKISKIKQIKPRRQIKQAWGISKHKFFAALTIVLMVSIAVGFIAGSNLAYPVAYNEGAKMGYTTGVTDTLQNVANLLQTKGVTLDWKQNTTDGSYVLTVTTVEGQTASLNLAMNLIITHYHNGQVVSLERGAGTFTNYGKNYTIQQILYDSTDIAGFASGGGTSGIPLPDNTGINATMGLLYLGDATTAGSSATSTVQPTETQSDGMGRLKETAVSYSAGSTGGGVIGAFNVTATKTCSTAGITVAEWGLYARPHGTTTIDINSLVAYDPTPGSKNLAVGDTLAETWTGTFS